MHESGIPHDELLPIYYYLRLTRALEERLGILYRQGKILGGSPSSLMERFSGER